MCNLIEDSSYEMISFPKDRKAIDVGDFVSDYTAFSMHLDGTQKFHSKAVSPNRLISFGKIEYYL